MKIIPDKIIPLASKFFSYLYISLLSYLMWIAWRVSGERYIVAEQGIGYWLGILSGILLLLMMVYPWRKRKIFPKWLGGVKFWFHVHMGLGIAAPCLVVLHSNFTLGSFNSRVALYCMMLVAASGLVGRFLYIKIHYGLSDERKKILNAIENILEQVDGIHALIPVVNEGVTWNKSEGEKLKQLAVSGQWQLRAQLILFEQQIESQANGSDHPQLKETLSRHFKKMRRSIASARTLLLFERLFSLWHVIHVPFFIMLVASVIFHVIAVHMY
ncbi:MAG: hypothetical protein OQJ77_06885 [Thiovulaceae bacterium]|nr:hypothetical protein [Sulfurimonadaceae bacterium]